MYLFQQGGPAQVVIPDLGLSTTILQVQDPPNDDWGPGTYTYPTDPVFGEQDFDLQSFSVGYDENDLIFGFTFYGAIPNPWGSPNNLAIQTLDVYIDTDPGEDTGARLLLPGRNAALSDENGWDIAIFAEGWYPEVFQATRLLAKRQQSPPIYA
jgi:carbohydrate-binding DOMON domain-containing protein